MNFLIYITFTIEMLQTKISNDWPCCFQQEVKNVKLLMMDARRMAYYAPRRTKTNSNRWYDEFSLTMSGLQSEKSWNVKKKIKNGDRTPIGSRKMEAHSNQLGRSLPKTVPSIDWCTFNHDVDNKMPIKCVARTRNRYNEIITCTVKLLTWGSYLQCLEWKFLRKFIKYMSIIN